MVDLTQIIVAVLTLVISLITAFLIPYLKTKVSAEKLDTIKFWAVMELKLEQKKEA